MSEIYCFKITQVEHTVHIKMPYILDMFSREIMHVDQIMGHWTDAVFHVKRLVNCHHDIEWEDVTVLGLVNNNMIMVQDRGSAYDIEYYTRGGNLNICTF